MQKIDVLDHGFVRLVDSIAMIAEAAEMKNVWVFDIDGTLADCSHRLHFIEQKPKDWTSFFAAVRGDAPIPHMVLLCSSLMGAENRIAFVSGRSDECRSETLAWLNRNIGYDAGDCPLYMRKAGDYRADDIVKMELLARLRSDGHEPIMVFDDRKRVVDAWRSAGVPCAQVAPGDF